MEIIRKREERGDIPFHLKVIPCQFFTAMAILDTSFYEYLRQFLELELKNGGHWILLPWMWSDSCQSGDKAIGWRYNFTKMRKFAGNFGSVEEVVSRQFLELRFLVIETCSYVGRAWWCDNRFVVEVSNYDDTIKRVTGMILGRWWYFTGWIHFMLRYCFN